MTIGNLAFHSKPSQTSNILDHPCLKFDQKELAAKLKKENAEKKQALKSCSNTNYLADTTSDEASISSRSSRRLIMPEHMRALKEHTRALKTKSGKLIDQICMLTKTPCKTIEERDQLKEDLFNRCNFYIVNIYDPQSKQNAKKPKALLMLETTIGNIPYTIPLSVEKHGKHIVLTERSDLIHQIDTNKHLNNKIALLPLSPQQKYSLLYCMKKLNDSRANMELPSLFSRKNTLLFALYQGGKQKIERDFSSERIDLKRDTATMISANPSKNHAHSATWSYDYIYSMLSDLASGVTPQGMPFTDRIKTDNKAAPIDTETSAPVTTEEDVFLDCHETEEPTEEQKTSIKKIVRDHIAGQANHIQKHLQKQASDNEGKNAISYGIREIKDIRYKLTEATIHIKNAIEHAQNKHKEVIDKRNKEMQERTTKGLLMTCVVIAACVAPVAAIPLFATIAFAGMATPVIFAGIALFGQLAAWVVRKSVLEPFFLNKLKAQQADKPASGNLLKHGLETNIIKAQSQIFKSFEKQKQYFEKEYSLQSDCYKQESFQEKTAEELHKLLSDHPIDINDHSIDINNKQLMPLLKNAIENVLDQSLSQQKKFIAALEDKANIASLYQHTNSDNSDYEKDCSSYEQDCSESKMAEMLEKELWAQYILDHHIGDADYKFSGRIEPAIIDRLESLGVIPESRIKSFFGFKKLDREARQALREWAIAFYNSTNQSLSSYNRLNQAIKNIQQLPGEEPAKGKSTEEKLTQEKTYQKTSSGPQEFFKREDFVKFNFV